MSPSKVLNRLRYRRKSTTKTDISKQTIAQMSNMSLLLLMAMGKSDKISLYIDELVLRGYDHEDLVRRKNQFQATLRDARGS